MIECSCNRIISEKFDDAVQTKDHEIRQAGNLLKAIGIAYRYARDTDPVAMPVVPSCTSCFGWVANRIQDKGYFRGDALPRRTREAGCPRVAQCFYPSPRLEAAE